MSGQRVVHLYVHAVSPVGDDGRAVDRLVESMTPRRGRPPAAKGWWTVFCGTQEMMSLLTQRMYSLTVSSDQLAVLMAHANVADPKDLANHRVRVVMDGELFVRWDGIPAASVIAARRRRLRQEGAGGDGDQGGQ